MGPLTTFEGVMENISREFLTIEQFALRLQISKSTAYSWIATGRIQAGAHLVHLGSVIRIVWSDDLLEHLLLESVGQDKKAGRPPLRRKGTGGRNRTALDVGQFDDLLR